MEAPVPWHTRQRKDDSKTNYSFCLEKLLSKKYQVLTKNDLISYEGNTFSNMGMFSTFFQEKGEVWLKNVTYVHWSPYSEQYILFYKFFSESSIHSPKTFKHILEGPHLVYIAMQSFDLFISQSVYFMLSPSPPKLKNEKNGDKTLGRTYLFLVAIWSDPSRGCSWHYWIV